jgi:hypothetical protein
MPSAAGRELGATPAGDAQTLAGLTAGAIGGVVTRILEPEPSPALAASHPGRADVPMFLVVRAARRP